MTLNTFNQLIQKLPEYLRNPETGKRIFVALCFTILAIGFFFRLDGYFFPSPSFTGDEAQIARYLSWDDGWRKTIKQFGSSRPIGYLAISKFIVDTYNVEETLRLTSLIPSLFTLVLVYLISRRLFKSGGAVITALLFFSFNPLLVSYAKEFKHYSLEIMIDAGLIYLFLMYLEKNDIRRFICLMIGAYLSIFFSTTVLFLFPGIFLYLIIIYLRDRNYKNIGIIILFTLLILSTILLFYVFLWAPSINKFINAWELKYKGFNGENGFNYLAWAAIKFRDIIFYLFKYPSSNLFVLKIIVFVFIILGIITAMVKFIDFSEQPFIIIFPLITVVVLNIFKIWPLGADRTNLPLLLYFVLLFSMGFQQLEIYVKQLDVLKAAAILVITVFVFPPGLGYYHKKRNLTHEDIKSPLEDLHNFYGKNGKIDLYLNPHAWIGAEYYLNYHEILSKKFYDTFKERFNIVVYKDRKDEYVKKFTRSVIENSQGDMLFLLYHFRIEKASFYDTLERYAYYNERIYENARLVHAVSKKNGTNRIPLIKPEKIIEAEDGAVFSAADMILVDNTASSKRKVTKTKLLFNVAIATPGEYSLKARICSLSRKKDLLLVRTENGNEKQWIVPVNKKWRWTVAPFTLNLKKRENTVELIIPDSCYCDQLYYEKTDKKSL